jgi:hypothetical protein
VTHRPAPPRHPEPPRELVEAADALRHRDVTRVGLTTTSEGDWALMVRTRPGTPTPIEDVERASKGHPVVYDVEPDEPPVARPAYPSRGE